mmetsp:Transcript_36895/g.62124  ORF Transcript_36895/g.62124 Transcript_36895/m.62124 type:complete len:207 (+) Transcript_36895:848-1468(+)
MPGKIPKEIKILTRVEVGMVGLCNPVMSMSVMHGSGQAYLKRYNCTLVKDVNEVARQLPRHMSLSDLAVLRPLHFASSDDDVQDITRKVDELDRTSRARLLGEHPALALRLSKLKVDAVWRLLITDGLAQPLGRVSDLWYRTEFQARLIDHIHAMVAVARKQLEDSLHANKSPLPDIVDTQVIACQPVAICVHIMVLFGRMLCGNT